jgi:uncharacterized protein Usg
MAKKDPIIRNDLNADAMRETLRERFKAIPDKRIKPSISLADALMSGFAVFALKDPSLLAFEERSEDPDSNLGSIFGIEHVPSDSQLRYILDEVAPSFLRPCFTDIFRQVQRGKALEAFRFLGDHHLLSFDGSGYFSSTKIQCPNCQCKHHRNGTVSYSHQMLSAVFVHPDLAEVLPVMPEPINKQDGVEKNDCELNAAKRFFPRFRQDHPRLKVIVVGDGLTANAPLIRLLRLWNFGFILVAKPGDHAFLFKQMEQAYLAGTAQVLTIWDETTGKLHHFRWLNKAVLNESNPDVLVNFLEYWEINQDGTIQTFSWVTHLELSQENVFEVMRGGRARWKVENETHNTLKNQGYHYEHNYGHGKKHLAVIFVMLMFLAFLVDQVQQLSCGLFRAVWEKMGSKRRLWDEMRHLFHSFAFSSMRELFEAMLKGFVKQKPTLANSS